MNVVLIGLSGTGKSAVGRELAGRLGWRFVDTDSEVVRAAGKPIHRIFAEDGEAAFREMEAAAVRRAVDGDRCVVSLGGGAVTVQDNREAISGSAVVLLEASVDTMLRRLRDEGTETRPLLASQDPAGSLRAMALAREAIYRSAAEVTVSTEGVDVASAADRVLDAIASRLDGGGPDGGRVHPAPGEYYSIAIKASSGSYKVLLGRDLLDSLGQLLKEGSIHGRARVIADETVYGLYGERLEGSLRRQGIEVASHTVPPGESSKTLETASTLYDWLVEVETERRDLILALGGGVVGDLAGFVAATFLRGLRLVQVPTSLLAQVDSSVGGKVAVDHPRGKNLIGAFYPPALVVADTTTLLSLPRREVSAALAEVAKHGMILDERLFGLMEVSPEPLLRLETDVLEPTIARSIEIKAEVVERDERESGLRAILNYGHTIGHAVEAVSRFEMYRHGEAVAIGMAGAAQIAVGMGILDPEGAARQNELLRQLELPVEIPGLPLPDLLSAMGHDKKASEGQVSWVLPEAVGRVTIRRDVPMEMVVETLVKLGARA